MRKLSPQDEQRMVASTEQLIAMTNQGKDPTDALEKIARDESYTPPFISHVAAAFNKSLSISVFRDKTASAEQKSDTFKLADPQEVCRRIYVVAEKEAAPFALPAAAADPVSPDQIMSKEADHRDPLMAHYASLTPQSVMARAEACRQSTALLLKTLRCKEAAAVDRMDQCIRRLTDHIARMPEASLEKMARLVVNGYPDSGYQLLRLLSNRGMRQIPMQQKTASAAVFPCIEPYLSVADVHVCAANVVHTHQDTVAFEKFASGIMDDLLDSAGSTMTEGLSKVLGDKKDAKKAEVPENELDPQFFNQLKEVDARKAFQDLALYDNDLKTYDMPTLIKAFNSSVASVPEAVQNPSALKTLMMQRISTGNVQDVFQVGQEAALRKTVAETGKIKQEAADKIKEKSKPAPEAEKPAKVTIGGAKGTGGLLSEILKGVVVKDSGKGSKPEKAGDISDKTIQRLVDRELMGAQGAVGGAKPIDMQAVANAYSVMTKGKKIDAPDILKVVQQYVKDGKDSLSQDQQEVVKALQDTRKW